MSRLWNFPIVCIILFSAIEARGIPADTARNAPDSIIPAKQAQPVPQIEQPTIVKVARYPDTAKRDIEPGDYVRFWVDKPDLLDSLGRKTNHFILFLDDLPMSGTMADSVPLADGSVLFHFTRTSEDSEVWATLYSYPYKFKRDVALAFGPTMGRPLANRKGNLNLILVRTNWFIVSMLAMLILLFLFLTLAAKSGLLRDLSMKGMTFSLSRSQLGLWTLLIVFAYLFIWVVTGIFPAMTGSTLILLGISIVSATGATLIDVNRDPAQIPVPTKSEGFLNDVLTDAVGMNIHRFQYLVWTVVLAIVFVREVIVNLSIPQFSDMQLALMGISSAGYLGLKTKEPTTSQAVPSMPTQTPAPL